MAQIRPVTSEALEKAIRDKLPSQNGFTEDLQAQNVIVPIIDLTDSTSLASTPEMLQTAVSFGGITSFDVNNTTTTLANSPGFWLIQSNITHTNNPSNIGQVTFNITDGVTTKLIFESGLPTATGVSTPAAYGFSFVAFLLAGESLTVVCTSTSYARGNYRQIADVNGDLVYPVGYTPQ